MSRRSIGVVASLALSMSGLVLVASPPAVAEAPTGTELATALDAPTGVAVSVVGNAESYSTTDKVFNDFPSRVERRLPRKDPATGQELPPLVQFDSNDSYVLLSTGKAAEVFGVNVPNDQPSTDFGGDNQPDVTSLRMDIAASSSPRCLLIDFAMGTEERVHTYTPETPGDYLSVKRVGDEREWSMNAGGAYITQEGMNRVRVPAPVEYQVNKVDYWHKPGDSDSDPLHNSDADPFHGMAGAPRLPAVSPVDSFTSRDTAEVPIPAGAAQTVNLTVADAGNGSLDSVAQVDRVRFAPSCSFVAEGMTPGTGVATGTGKIEGHQGVGNILTLDPVASTPAIEKYDAPFTRTVDSSNSVLDTPGNGWFPTPVDLRFRWYRSVSSGTGCYSTALANWVAITDADRQSYVPTNLDMNRCLMVLVTGKKDGYRTETFPIAGSGWYVTLPIQEGTFFGQAPAIVCVGTPTVGTELSAGSVGYVPRPNSYEYQWFAGGAAISGATGKTVKLSANEAGKAITVRVKAMRSGVNPRTETSAPCGPVATMAMTSTPRPIITGAGVLGQPLEIVTGEWVPASPSFGYQWRIGSGSQALNISGANSATYTPKADDVGKQITVAVTGGKTGYTSVTTVSDPVTIGLGQLSSSTPYVSGTPVVGGRLTGTTTGWTSGTNLTYVWSAGGQVFQQGSSKSFTIPAGAVGRSVTLTVRGEKSGYGTTERSSVPTAPVASAALRTSTPRITGTPKVGRTLRASAAGWGPAGVRLTYRWAVNGKLVTSSSTRTTLKIKKAWKNKRISVQVTGSALGYTMATRSSAKTAKVKK